MFRKEIHIKKKNQIRYGTTTIAFEKTFGEIMALLRKHKCEQIMTLEKESFQQIGFTIDMRPYIIVVPRVYVDGVYHDNIGIRIVKYFLETILELVKERIVDIEFLMLGSRMMRDRDTGEMLPVGEWLKALPEWNEDAKLLE